MSPLPRPGSAAGSGPRRALRASFWALMCAVIMIAHPAVAQNIVRDNTPGQDNVGIINPDANGTYTITGDDGVKNADNTFVMHSMTEFQLDEGEIARFTDNANDIVTVRDVLVRVTGGNTSTLSGRIESLYNDADLLFVNPNGVLFGSTFSIDVQQSFVVSTADLIELQDIDPNTDERTEVATIAINGDIDNDGGIPDALPAFTSRDARAFGFLAAGPAGGDIIVDGFNADGSDPNAPENGFVFFGHNIQFATGQGAREIFTNGRNLLAVGLGESGWILGDGTIGDDIPLLLNEARDSFLPRAGGQIVSRADFTTTGDGFDSGALTLLGREIRLVSGSIDTGATGAGLFGGDVILVGRDIDIAVDIDTSSVFDDAGDVVALATNSIQFFGGPRNIDTRGGFAADAGAVFLQGSSELVADRLTIQMADPNRGNAASLVQLIGGQVSFAGSTVEASTSVDGGAGFFFATGENVDLTSANINLENNGTSGTSVISITGTDTVDLSDAILDASATSGSNGGSVTVQFGELTQNGGTEILVDGAIAGTIEFIQLDVSPTDTPPDDDFAPAFDPLLVGLGEDPGGAGLLSEDVSLSTGPFGFLSTGIGFASFSPNAQRTARNRVSLREARKERALTLTAATEAEAQREDDASGSVSIFTQAGQHAPLVPRTCRALAERDRKSRLLARANQGLPASPEDWLIAYDASGDRLLAATRTPGLSPVAAIAPQGAETRGPTDAGAQQDLTEAALAIRAGLYEDAAAHFTRAIDALLASDDPRSASEAMLAYAQLQLQEGHYRAAQRELERALEIARPLGDEAHVSAIRTSLGNALIATGQFSQAEEELTRGLAVAGNQPQAADTGAVALHHLGNKHAAERDLRGARRAFERSAKLAGWKGLIADEARARLGIARVAVESGDLGGGLREIRRARPLIANLPRIEDRVPLSIHMGSTLGAVATHSRRHRKSALRDAFDAFDQARRSAEEAGDLRGVALANLNLGALYQEEQHRAEALYLTRLARRAAEGISAPEILYRTHWQEGQILWGQHQVEASLSALRRAVGILEETKPIPSEGYGSSDALFRRQVGAVYRDAVDHLLRASALQSSAARSQALVLEARDVLERFKAAELRDYFEDECIASAAGGGRAVDSLGAGAAVIYTVTLPDRLELLVALPRGVERVSVPVSQARLHKTVDRFRNAVQNPLSRNYLKSARQLHDWLVRPIAGRLEEQQIETVVMIPDGRLRTVPFSALHDGQQYLGERYALATALSLRLLVPSEVETQAGRPVLAGVSEGVQGFSPLAAVDQEIAQIRDTFGGEVLLNRDFTLDQVRGAVARETPGVVHLATHAVFSGNPKTSFLLTYGGRVGFDDLSDVVGMTRADGAPLDLLVLSACETAVGNDRAGLGFTGSAIRAGARSALGSLWPISDAAAGALMVDFYRGLGSAGQSKARALQQAQAKLREDDRFAHPYYWAPFTLVNDWL